MERLAPQIQQREEALPLRERVKNVFKKYGWTLQAVVLATGLVLGAVALAAINGLKAGTQAVGKGLKTIGQKLGSLLPGYIARNTTACFCAPQSKVKLLWPEAKVRPFYPLSSVFCGFKCDLCIFENFSELGVKNSVGVT